MIEELIHHAGIEILNAYVSINRTSKYEAKIYTVAKKKKKTKIPLLPNSSIIVSTEYLQELRT